MKAELDKTIPGNEWYVCTNEKQLPVWWDIDDNGTPDFENLMFLIYGKEENYTMGCIYKVDANEAAFDLIGKMKEVLKTEWLQQAIEGTA